MRLRNISKSYGGAAVFDNFTLDLENGSVTWIMGKSGCGKTTLLRIIAGLEDFDGEISDRPSGGLSMVFQEDRLFEQLNAEDNCLLAAPHMSREEISGHLFRTGLDRDGIHRPVRLLSGGMRRRAVIVRALCALYEQKGGILLLDEPFKGLDGRSRELTAELTGELCSGSTVIAVTHDIEDTGLLKGRLINIR